MSADRITQAEADLLALMAASPGTVDLRKVGDRQPIITCFTAKWIERAPKMSGYVITASGRKALAEHKPTEHPVSPKPAKAAEPKPRTPKPTKSAPAALSAHMNTSDFWLERDAELRQLAGDGLSMAAAAAVLGVSKNAVIGRARRIGIVWARSNGPHVKSVAVSTTEFPGPGRCVWPHGHPGEDGFRFCGDQAEAGPYCDKHRAVAYVPAGRREVVLKQIEWAPGKGDRAA